MINWEVTLLAIILGILIGIAYSLRRIFILERKINSLEKKVLKNVKKSKKKKK